MCVLCIVCHAHARRDSCTPLNKRCMHKCHQPVSPQCASRAMATPPVQYVLAAHIRVVGLLRHLSLSAQHACPTPRRWCQGPRMLACAQVMMHEAQVVVFMLLHSKQKHALSVVLFGLLHKPKGSMQGIHVCIRRSVPSLTWSRCMYTYQTPPTVCSPMGVWHAYMQPAVQGLEAPAFVPDAKPVPTLLAANPVHQKPVAARAH